MGLIWPLIGRAEELRFIGTATRVGAGLRGVVLAGAAGVGKTRLAREAVAAAGQRGAAARWAVGTVSAQSLPLGAFAALVGAVGEESARLVPARLVPEATAALLAGAGRAGVVVGVDDAHLLDELSALLVHQLVLRSAATVVITVRTGEPAPDAVTALWKDGHVDRLEVQPLSEAETGALLEAVLGGPVDSTAAGRMWALTRGNALYLRQLVDGEIEAGRLRAEGEVWRWSGIPVVSPGLAELVAVRMGGLSEPVREVVDVLALGEPLGATLLGQLTDPAAVEQAEAAGLVHAEPDGRRLQARLAHPLYGETRRAAIGRLRARRLRGRIAQALADTGGRRADDTLRRAVLAVDSDLDPDPVLLTEAAGRAAQLCDLPLAERLGRAALAAGGGFPAQMLVASAVAGLLSRADSEIELAALTALAGSDAELIRATVSRVFHLTWIAPQPTEAEALLDAVEARVGGDAARLQLTAIRAYLVGSLGRAAAAIQHATAALAWPDLPDESVVLASCGLIAGLATLGRADEIGPAAARGRAAATRSTELAFMRIPLAALQVHGLRLAGYLDDAVAAAAECRDAVKGLPVAAELSGYAVGEAELARGRAAGSLRWLREANAGMAGSGDAGGFRYVCLLSLTRALAVTGDVEAARLALADLEASRHPTLVVLEPELLLARAWVAAAEGAVSEAIGLAHEAAGTAAGRTQPTQELFALHTAVCFGDPSGAARLADLAARVDGPRAPAAAAHAAALAADDGPALLAASAQLERMGDLLSAADAAAHAAAAHTRHDQRAAARAAAARAHRLAEACGGARSPALIAAVTPLPLTDREREIVTLAAGGQSNQQIADRLTVSIRTVEGHLYRANAKLGTSDRTQLAALIRGD